MSFVCPFFRPLCDDESTYGAASHGEVPRVQHTPPTVRETLGFPIISRLLCLDGRQPQNEHKTQLTPFGSSHFGSRPFWLRFPALPPGGVAFVVWHLTGPSSTPYAWAEKNAQPHRGFQPGSPQTRCRPYSPRDEHHVLLDEADAKSSPRPSPAGEGAGIIPGGSSGP